MQKIKDFFKNNKDKIFLTICAILIATCSFAAGKISVDKKTPPIEIKENTSKQQTIEPENKQIQQNINIADTTQQQPKQIQNKPEKLEETTKNTKDNCEYVASSRGHKYYEADSSSAKSLSEKNKICFPNEKEAIKAGYEPSASIK